MTALQREQKDRRNSRNISIGIHILLLLAFFFLGFKSDVKKNIDTQYAVSIAFDNKVSSNSTKSQASEGAQKQKAESRAKEERKPTKKVEKLETKITKPKVTTPAKPKPKITTPTPKPQPTEPVVSTDLEVESPVVAVEEDIQVEEPEAEVYTEPEPIEIPTTEPVEVADDAPSLEDVLAEIETEAEATESEESGGQVGDVEESTEEEAGGGSKTDGDKPGTGSGYEGEGAGNHEGGDDASSGIGTGGEGLGEYDDSGDGIFGRRVTHRDRSMILNASGKSGTIVMKVCITRNGNVAFVELNEFETTIKDRKVIKNALKAMWKYKYEKDQRAPKEECGKFKVSVQNWQGVN